MSLSAQIRDKAATLWHFQRVRQLVRQQAGLAPQVIVSVAEIPCEDPACPGPATQITILGLDLIRRRLVIHRPVAQVTEAGIAAALRMP
ncbi:MAG: hypothetical protein ACK41U_13740 [Paracoccus sp. (in: a-proteobacteria)]|uniref:hypothetical protein n=1 Tax=Paracoccus sp. TaxID=267 RepID=UPI00391B8B23